MLKRLRLVDISIPRNRRQPMKGRIASVAQSMRTIGQLHPILVAEEGNRLIAGLTRYRAAECLDWKDILCNVVDFDKLHAELAEIDENVERSQLTAMEEATAMARRKAIYLELHPETAAGVAGAVAKHAAEKSATDKLSVAEPQDFSEKTPSFAQDAADKLGVDERTIRRMTAIGENLAPEAAKILKDTDIAESKSQLAELVKLKPQKQCEVAQKIKSGKARTVKEAKGKPRQREATEADTALRQIKIWADTIGRWLSGNPSIDDFRNQWPGPQGDRVMNAAKELFESLKAWKAVK